MLSGRERTRSFKFAPSDHVPAGYSELITKATGSNSLMQRAKNERNKHRFQDFERSMKCSEIIDDLSQESIDSNGELRKLKGDDLSPMLLRKKR